MALPCAVPVLPSFLFSFFFFHTAVFSFPAGGWFGSVRCLCFLDRPGPGWGPDLLDTLSCSFAVSFKKHGNEKERERMKWREGLTATERQNERRERNGNSRGGNAGAAGLPEHSRTGPEENLVVKKLRGPNPRTRGKKK